MLTLILLATGLTYPAAPKGTVQDDYAGRKVDAPYRWMEDLDSPQTRAWVESEVKVTTGYLDQLPQRESIRKRMTELWNFPRTDVPDREAGHLFYRHNSGLQKQSVLYRDEQVLVLDPNQLFPDGSTAVGQMRVSPDGRWLVWSAAPGGSDVRDLHVRDLKSGKDLEAVERVKFSDISFTADSKGFFYQRFKGTEKSVEFAKANTFHQVWYHRIGAKTADRLIFERPQNPRDYVGGQATDDGRWLFLVSASGTHNNRAYIADLKDPRKPQLGAAILTVSAEEDSIVQELGVAGGKLYIQTTFEAPNGRVVTAKIGDPDRSHWTTVVPETKDPIRDTLLLKDGLAVHRLHDVQSRVELYDLAGKPGAKVELPEAGSVYDFTGKTTEGDFWFTFTSFLRPRTVYRCDAKTGAITPFHEAKSSFDSSQYETREIFYPSKDGTRVPMFITAKKGIALDGSHPTALYAYGGFDISIQPSYSSSVATWLDMGGVYASANLRGGSEYGEDWHHAGMREKKQNVFDDFIAAAEYLEKEGWTSPQKLAVRGGSNGGLLIGAVANQRPDLFAVALPAVGVMDMLRYQKFTGGALWANEYGSSDEPAMLPVLLAYSPLHNVKPGCHPATLVTTADRDDRVVPSHSFQYAAALQAAQTCDKPVLIRIETAGSHGYRPTDRIIAEQADIWAFALANMTQTAPAPAVR